MRIRSLAPAGLVAVALVAAACGSSGSGGTAASGGGATVTTAKVMGATVLTNSGGFTLYWFVPDTSTTSNCNNSCATYWPPVKGSVTLASGVTGTLGSITRSDGSVQATFDGHPLYTYVGDKAPGQNTGNGLNLSGGVWHEVTVSGSAAPASSPTATSHG